MKFNAMFQPIEIGPMTVKNRFVVPPMGNNFANTDGTMSEQSAAYYKERAKGGFGLITIEATVVHKGAKGGPRKPCLYDDSTIESFRKVIDGCHAEGAKVSIQLQNAGPEGNAKNAGAPIKAASSICTQCGRDIPQTLTKEEIYHLVDGYADAPWQIDSDEVIVLHVLAVHPYYRGKGLARRLVENVIEQERKAGKKALRLDVIENNTTAEKLYQKLGFRYIQTKTPYYDVVGEMTFKLYELVL